MSSFDYDKVFFPLIPKVEIIDHKGILVLPVSVKNLVIYKVDLVGHHYDRITLFKLSDITKKCIYLVVFEITKFH